MDKKTKLEALEELKTAIKTGCYMGLCQANLVVIPGKKYYYLYNLIKSYPTFRGRIDHYYWKPYKVKPRIKWIDKRIRELQNDL